ncbi:MAG: DUF2095 family protein [Candidatus Nezhaarchaeota archaeon]|nr:DUF2095 family protein [Candidatus Nezhaarchaeota archaeon]MCX8141863.1 DUF2095 family protein [Candidatus Nezhaarchaeota archaeon]MDW8050356.1 DUF2095 family protein [Nitrososphaerota archaeon]
MIEMDVETLKKKYPNLARELENKIMCIKIKGSRTSDDNIRTGLPDAVDYIRRCKSIQEAEEVISYLERTKQITKPRASELREQLYSQGLKSFGPHKEFGYYMKEHYKKSRELISNNA